MATTGSHLQAVLGIGLGRDTPRRREAPTQAPLTSTTSEITHKDLDAAAVLAWSEGYDEIITRAWRSRTVGAEGVRAAYQGFDWDHILKDYMRTRVVLFADPKLLVEWVRVVYGKPDFRLDIESVTLPLEDGQPVRMKTVVVRANGGRDLTKVIVAVVERMLKAARNGDDGVLFQLHRQCLLRMTNVLSTMAMRRFTTELTQTPWWRIVHNDSDGNFVWHGTVAPKGAAARDIVSQLSENFLPTSHRLSVAESEFVPTELQKLAPLVRQQHEGVVLQVVLQDDAPICDLGWWLEPNRWQASAHEWEVLLPPGVTYTLLKDQRVPATGDENPYPASRLITVRAEGAERHRGLPSGMSMAYLQDPRLVVP